MGRFLPARDAEVPPKEESELGELAVRLRRLAAVDHQKRIDLQAVLDYLVMCGLPQKGRLNIERRNPDPKRYEALVTYNPLTLSIEAQSLVLAGLGNFAKRFIVAHEIGHMVIHDDFAKPFSIEPVTKNIFSDWRKSAEWQANRFADHLLLPDHILIDMHTFEQAAKMCCIDEALALRRFSCRSKARAQLRSYNGQCYVRCHNYTEVEKGLFKQCDTCDLITDYDL